MCARKREDLNLFKYIVSEGTVESWSEPISINKKNDMSRITRLKK